MEENSDETLKKPQFELKNEDFPALQSAAKPFGSGSVKNKKKSVKIMNQPSEIVNEPSEAISKPHGIMSGPSGAMNKPRGIASGPGGSMLPTIRTSMQVPLLFS